MHFLLLHVTQIELIKHFGRKSFELYFYAEVRTSKESSETKLHITKNSTDVK